MKSIHITLALLGALSLKAADHKILVQGNNQFAFDLYHKLEKNTNVFFSPYSVSAALGMTYAGAKGETAKEMQDVLHIGNTATFHQDFSTLMQSINTLNGENVKMRIANRLFGEKQFTFLESYLKQVKDLYNAPLEKTDFLHNADASRLHINKWVEDQTNNKIKNLIPAGAINALTRLVLVNAIYFYGDWATEFEKDLVKKDKFYVSAESSITASLMFQQGSFQYAETGTFKAIRIPYKGHTVSMEVYLPHNKNGLAEWEKELNAENYAKWSGAFSTKKVNLTLPKFSMTYSSSMAKILANMGMPSAFKAGADFSGMTGKKDLYISDVIHKAFIDVNEKGTEAAAATAVIMRTESVRMPEPEPTREFKADHPFFFILRDNKSGTILFMGRVTEPTKA